MKGFCKLQLVYCLLFWYPPGETWLSWEALPPRYKYPHALPLAENHLQTPPAGRQKMKSETAFEQPIPSLCHTWALQGTPRKHQGPAPTDAALGTARLQGCCGMSTPKLWWGCWTQKVLLSVLFRHLCLIQVDSFSAPRIPKYLCSSWPSTSAPPSQAQHLIFLLIFDSHLEKGSFSLIIKAALHSGQHGNKNFFHLKQSIFTGHKETTPATKVHLYFNQQK